MKILCKEEAQMLLTVAASLLIAPAMIVLTVAS
jgi:hypothetical protein